MSNGQIPSKPVMVFSTTQPKLISARFIYNFYQKTEAIYPDADSIDINKPVPRKVELTFTPVRHLAAVNEFGEALNPFIGEIIAQKEKITSEILLQSAGYLKYNSDTERDYSFYLTSPLGADEDKSKLKAFFENASVYEGQEFADTPEDTEIYLNTSTNRPTSKSANIYAEQANQSLIATDFCFDLIEASAANPFSIHSKKNYNDLRELKSLQTRHRRRVNPAIADPADYVVPIDFLDFDQPDQAFGLIDNKAGLGIIGYIIFKTRIDSLGNHLDDLGSFIVTGMDTTTHDDYQVAYGDRYKYNIHPIYVIKPTANAREVFAMIGARGKSVKLYCVENVPPPPVEAITFKYFGNNNVGLSWATPTQYGQEPSRVVGDIKGYQIFIRKSYDEPFQIVQYITFNDMIGLERFPLPEYIPPNLITRTGYNITQWLIKLKKDTDYIVAMCTIDAHGNSSNLSPQYIVRIESSTNAVKVDFASYKGAPKQYPNMLMSKKIFIDCIKVSKKNKMTVYFDPKLLKVNLSPNGNDPISVLPDSTTDVPSYRIQLINVTKQSDKVLDIFIKDST